MIKVFFGRIASLVALACVFSTIGCGNSASNKPLAPPVDPATAATITGTVTFAGTPPVLKPIDMSAAPACVKANPTPVVPPEVVTGPNDALANVVVYVKSGLGNYRYPTPQNPIVLDQTNCMYTPHVVALMVGQPFSVANSDPTMHNVHVMARHNRQWSSSQPVGSVPLKSTFERPEFAIPVLCNIHPWMRAYVFAFDQPYFAVTSTDGTFAIKNLPPGTYTIEAWHEPHQTLDQTVTVDPKQSKAITFTFHSGS
ncbi:MAG TPA: carboxypeptidase regulatory-like domain-containing protein [Candidatus Dormibacteraeota bacterium]|nr:carboxypeptidase regulatory-like domain-containing protein [Candidatus Dormibacteraeota bacterium]